MSEATLALVMVLLGPVVFVLVEGAKALALVTGRELSGSAKLKLALCISLVVGLFAGLASGQVDLAPLLEAMRGVSDVGMLPALMTVLYQAGQVVGLVATISQAVYVLLRKSLKQRGWLSFALSGTAADVPGYGPPVSR